jgi:hypothetical protein
MSGALPPFRHILIGLRSRYCTLHLRKSYINITCTLYEAGIEVLIFYKKLLSGLMNDYVT